jgi:hypothetical protein
MHTRKAYATPLARNGEELKQPLLGKADANTVIGKLIPSK